ncbi:MAG: hypothetical protein ABSG17_05915 [Spirochaetia bacterium]|jgi:hypothetical protein
MTGKTFGALAAVALCLLFAAPAGLLAQSQGKAVQPPPAAELQAALRDLWVGHIFWVRNVALMTRLGNMAGAKVAEGQVVQDARDIANAISPYYGQPAADTLFGLLAAHYGAIKEYMTATYAGKKSAQEAAKAKLEANAEEIASFLSSANPNWPKEDLLGALQAHAMHHVMQIDAFNVKDFKTEATVWNEMKGHIYTVADVLAQGIEKQFGSREQ